MRLKRVAVLEFFRLSTRVRQIHLGLSCMKFTG